MSEIDYNKFFIESNKLRVYKYLCVYTQKCWDYNHSEEIDFQNRNQIDITHKIYLADESQIPNNTPKAFENDYVNKHANLSIVSIEPLDVTDIEWMDGIPIDNSVDYNVFIKKLYNMGEDNYKKSLTSTVDDYMTNLDYRLCMIEMGL